MTDSRDKLRHIPDAYELLIKLLDRPLWFLYGHLVGAMCAGTGIDINAAQRLIGAVLSEGIARLDQRLIDGAMHDVVWLNNEYRTEASCSIEGEPT